MNKPDIPLWESSYSEDWKCWIKWYLSNNSFESNRESVIAVLRETQGKINPKWVEEIYND